MKGDDIFGMSYVGLKSLVIVLCLVLMSSGDFILYMGAMGVMLFSGIVAFQMIKKWSDE